MRVTAVGFYAALGLGTLAALALAGTSGCGQLWRPFLDPEITAVSDLAVVDLASAPDPSDLATLPWTVEPSGTTQTLYGVWGIRSTTTTTTVADGGMQSTVTMTQQPVFAVGAAGTILQRALGVATWRATSLNLGSTADFYAVTGRTASNVVAVGAGQLVASWDGTRWTPTPTMASDAFLAVTPTAAQNTYVAVGAAGLLTFLNGTTRSIPTSYTRGQADLTSVYTGEKIGWVGTGRGDLLKYDQSDFTAYGLPVGNAVRGIWARGPSEVWAVGDGGYILRFDGTRWSTSTTSFPAFTLGLHGVTGNSRGEVWMVGDNGTILYFSGTAWTRWQHPSLVTLRGIYLEPITGGLWAVGDQGMILHTEVAGK